MNTKTPVELPSSIDAEQALLGAILLNNEAYHRVSDFLRPDHFHEQAHSKIFKTCADLIQSGRNATPVTLQSYFKGEILDGITWSVYFARLATNATTVLNAADFGKVIRDHAVRRELIFIAEEIQHEAYQPDASIAPTDIIEETEKALFSLSVDENRGKGVQEFGSAVRSAIEMAQAAYQNDGEIVGLSTGLRDLDALLGGLKDSDLIVLAARPGMGKTSLVTNVAFSIASKFAGEEQPDGKIKTTQGGQVLFFSLEMSSEQLATRIISDQARVPSNLIRRGKFREKQFSDIMDVSNRIKSIPLHIDERGGLNIAQVVSTARRVKRQKGVDIIVIDYIQLLAGTSKQSGNSRVQEITEITTKLKGLAKELNVPIIALSQLSRQVENRENKRPQLADLRDSGSIEQDADVVLFIYREEYYLANAEPTPGSVKHVEWQAEIGAVHGEAEIIIAKQRHGATGIVPVHFDASITRFSDRARGAPPEGITI